MPFERKMSYKRRCPVRKCFLLSALLSFCLVRYFPRRFEGEYAGHSFCVRSSSSFSQQRHGGGVATTSTTSFQLDPNEARAIENLQPGDAWRGHAFFAFLVKQTLQYRMFKCETMREDDGKMVKRRRSDSLLRQTKKKKTITETDAHHDEFKYVRDVLLKQLPSYESVQRTLFPAPRGIVFTLPQTAVAAACVKRTLDLLHKTDASLPVEIWTFDGGRATKPYEFCTPQNDRENALRRDDNQPVVACRDMRAHASSLGLGSKLLPATRFEYCVYAIYFSGFQDVLFLDYDAAPLRGVSHLFRSRRFQESGQLYYSDLWGSNTVGWGQTAQSTSDIWSLTRVKNYATREMESGIVLLNKRARWRELNIALHLTRHTDVMQSQKSPSHGRSDPIIYGDKDIWRLAHYILRSDFIMGTAVLLASHPDDVARRLVFGANATCAVGTIGHIDATDSSRVLFAHQPKTLEVPFVSKAHIAIVDLKCENEDAYPGPVVLDCRRCWQRKSGGYDYTTGELLGVQAEWVKHECVGDCAMNDSAFATYTSNASFV